MDEWRVDGPVALTEVPAGMDFALFGTRCIPAGTECVLPGMGSILLGTNPVLVRMDSIPAGTNCVLPGTGYILVGTDPALVRTDSRAQDLGDFLTLRGLWPRGGVLALSPPASKKRRHGRVADRRSPLLSAASGPALSSTLWLCSGRTLTWPFPPHRESQPLKCKSLCLPPLKT